MAYCLQFTSKALRPIVDTFETCYFMSAHSKLAVPLTLFSLLYFIYLFSLLKCILGDWWLSLGTETISKLMCVFWWTSPSQVWFSTSSHPLVEFQRQHHRTNIKPYGPRTQRNVNMSLQSTTQMTLNSQKYLCFLNQTTTGTRTAKMVATTVATDCSDNDSDNNDSSESTLFWRVYQRGFSK